MKFKEGDWVFTIQSGVCQVTRIYDASRDVWAGGCVYLPSGTVNTTDKHPSLFTLDEALRMGFITEKDLPK